MKNPFKFGKVVLGKDFLNREKERKVVTNNIISAQNTLIYSERRIGKTSLILQSIEDVKKSKNITMIYIDVSECNNFKHFLEKISMEITNNIYAKTGSVDKCLKILGKFLKTLRPKVSIDDNGKPSFSFYFEDQNEEINAEIFNAISKIKKEKIPLVVIFDEFQEIRRFNGERIEKIIRAKTQHHRDIAYIFSGSKKRLLLEMFTKEGSPFFKSCMLMEIKNIDKERWESYIADKCNSTGKKISKGVINSVLNFCSTAYSIQMLMHMCWILSKKNIDSNIVNMAIKEIINYEQEKYKVINSNLTGYQRKVLLSILAEPFAEIYSESHLKRYNLRSQASVQSAIERLVSNEILIKEDSKFRFLDEFFQAWLENVYLKELK